MAGFIVLDDGRAYAAAGWATDAVIRAVSGELCDGEFKEWLLQQQRDRVGLGMTNVDMGTIAPHHRRELKQAIRAARARMGPEPPASWGDAKLWPGWLVRFDELVQMLDSIDRGEPPEAYNPHMRATIPQPNERQGPGWEEL